jgi:dipeptidyl aminopeptidase/acylaminoacyl peptidase
VSYNDLSLQATFDVSNDVLVYRQNNPRKLTWKDRDGRSRGSIGEIGRDMNPAIAPDGSDRIATDRSDPKTNNNHVWISDPQGRLSQVTSGAIERFPTWSPDGKSIVYTSMNGGVFEMRRRSSTGANREETLRRDSIPVGPLDVSPDFLIYGYYQPAENRDLWALPLTGNDRSPRQVTHTPDILETTARLSPDGRWLAYTAGERNQMNIWVQEFPSGAPAQQISVNGGRDPNWRADGKELYYMATAPGALMAVNVTTGPSLAFSTPDEAVQVSISGMPPCRSTLFGVARRPKVPGQRSGRRAPGDHRRRQLDVARAVVPSLLHTKTPQKSQPRPQDLAAARSHPHAGG